LHFAAGIGHEAVVAALLGVGAGVNDRSTSGKSPLHRAMESGHAAVVRALLRLGGVDVKLQDRSGRTALAYAKQQGHTAVVRVLKAAAVAVSLQ